jgi:hypothetical protein
MSTLCGHDLSTITASAKDYSDDDREHDDDYDSATY